MSEFRFFAFSDYAFHPNHSQRLIDLPIQPYYATERYGGDAAINASGAPTYELNVPYTVFEILVAVFAVVGNLMVIIVFQRERKLRRRTNYYIVSLAMADFLVGSLGVPFAILASIGLPTNLYACLFTVSLLIVLCTISIFCLVAVSVDRYWAILYPMAYSRNVRTKTAIIIISLCWLAGSVVGFLPLFGWHADVALNQACLFTQVMDYNYLVFLYFATIITPALLMLAFYLHIYRVIVKQVRQIVTMNPVGDCSRRSSAQLQLPLPTSTRPCHGGTMLRVLGASRKREVKATQNLSIIVLFFMICWFPLYTINCIQAFCDTCVIPPKLTLFCIILSHLNSAVNPVLYAYHLRDFRAALKNLILRVMGVEIEPTVDPMHRFSLASQHRLQSIDANMRNTLHPRIYIGPESSCPSPTDSPIWLRQQQQRASKTSPLQKFGVISPCLNNLNQTVTAVVAVTPEVERKMWNIREVSSGAELGEVNYIFPPDDDDDLDTALESNTPTPPPRQNRQRPAKQQSLERSKEKSLERCESPYSYENHNYATSDAELVDEVFLPIVTDSGSRVPNGNAKGLSSAVLSATETLITAAMREKLRSDDTDYLTHLHSSEHVLSDSSYSDCEPTSAGDKRLISASLTSSPCASKQRLYTPAAAASSGQLESAAVYVIEQQSPQKHSGGSNCSSPRVPSHRARLKSLKHSRSSNLQRSLSRSCNSDSSAHTAPPSNGTAKALAAASPTAGSATSSCGTLDNSGSQATSNNNNSHTANNLNHYTQQQPPPQPQPQRRQASPHSPLSPTPSGKFSPLKAVSNFLFPPIVKHSSLFQLFHHSHNNTASEDDETVTPTVTTTTTIATPTTSTTASECAIAREDEDEEVDAAGDELSAQKLKESPSIEQHHQAMLVALPATDS